MIKTIVRGQIYIQNTNKKTNIDNIDVVVRNFIKAYYSKNELFGLRSYDLKYFKDIIYCINHAKLKTKKV